MCIVVVEFCMLPDIWTMPIGRIALGFVFICSALYHIVLPYFLHMRTFYMLHSQWNFSKNSIRKYSSLCRPFNNDEAMRKMNNTSCNRCKAQ